MTKSIQEHVGDSAEPESAASVGSGDEQFPDGKLNPDDEGALSMAIGSEDGRVRIEFPKLVKWIALPPDMAIDVAEILIQHARECGSTKPLNIMVEQSDDGISEQH